MQFTSLALAALLSVARAIDVHVVAVGKNPGKNETSLKFFPDKIEAKPGTMVQFQFWAGNHTVTQSNFDNPCVPISSVNSSARGIFSSFQPAAASAGKGMIPVFTVMVNDSKPMWLFCSQGPHCQKGMAMVINENTSANATRSLENYKKLAQNAQMGSGEIPSGGAGGGTGGSSPPSGGQNGGSSPTLGGGSGSPVTTTGLGGTPAPAQTTAPLSAGGVNLAVPSTMLLALGAGFMLL
ncbi:hypothetical protein QQS21_005893 [Conoideocrella luteorostrata]|uniref:Extracellular serine-rich protein n=1 Tax=Conoideocrella luteorostrata TaxID=1105319 RepID=A0AAJ0CNL3_9HYPO|nr:hypothetical protein QQS21_005893 [Conoideocrella luteorostrata]